MNNYSQVAEKHDISADQVKDLKLGMFEIWGHVGSRFNYIPLNQDGAPNPIGSVKIWSTAKHQIC